MNAVGICAVCREMDSDWMKASSDLRSSNLARIVTRAAATHSVRLRNPLCVDHESVRVFGKPLPVCLVIVPDIDCSHSQATSWCTRACPPNASEADSSIEQCQRKRCPAMATITRRPPWRVLVPCLWPAALIGSPRIQRSGLACATLGLPSSNGRQLPCVGSAPPSTNRTSSYRLPPPPLPHHPCSQRSPGR